MYRTGKTQRSANITLHYSENSAGITRVAVVVSKKVAKTAPRRNRIRRRLFETVRKQLPRIQLGNDLLFTVFSEELYVTPASEVERTVVDLLDRAGIIEKQG